MAASSPEDNASPGEAEDNDHAESANDTKKLPTPRRRTKTGCLTCRRRRIKCGEERPICKNCVKSKRECAGYVQPLVYKQQQTHSSYPDHRIGAPQFQPSTPNLHQFQTGNNDATERYQQMEQSQPGLPHSTSAWAWPPLPTSRALAAQLQWPEGEFDWSELQRSKAHPQLQINTAISTNNWPSQLPFSSMSYDPGRRTSEAFTEGTNSTGPGSASRSTSSTPYRRHPSATDASFTGFSVERSNVDATKAFDSARRTNFMHDPHQLRHPSGLSIHEEHPAQYDSYGFLQRKSINQSDWRTPTDTAMHQATVDEIEDPDDPFDVEIDEAPELLEDYPSEDAMKLLQQHKQSRKYYANTLVHHRKPNLVSPILEDKYSNSFSHFVSYLVPCISIFERPPTVNMNGLVKSTWGLHLPSAAVSRSALAHAILALGALHLSALKGTSEDTAMKHFTCALRRLGKLLAMPNRRHEAATLATVLLLSFYEVVSGDHSRWIMHLSGAGSFLMEHDFATMIRTVRQMRSRARDNIQQPWVATGSPLSHSDYVRIADIPEALLHDDDWDVDPDLVGRLTGLDINYDENFQKSVNVQDISELTQKEVEDWKVKMDLYWWYCKMDIYHSALSGDPLLLSFEQWKHCPPRGPLGKSSIVCATTDHLLLILARLTEFAGKDLKRKQEVIASRGGHWIPAPGFLEPGKPGVARTRTSPMDGTPSPEGMNRNEVKKEHENLPPTANESRTRKSKPSITPIPGHSSKPPPFYGMMPPASGPLHMHSSFHIMEAQLRSELQDKATSKPSVDQASSLDVQTQQALEEHASITEAFEIWTNALGPDFEPLSDTPETTVRTPFGPALRYADPLIACTWALYHMGKILQRRVHPYSPPAAMMSAGINAQFTRDSAQIIGRIVGGLHAELQKATQLGQFDPVAIAATQETTFPLMFAAVQYQDAGQRGWTINKLRDVAEGSGWKSSTAVASACETTWHEMGKSGKGPPYEKTLDHRHVGVRGMGRYHTQRASNLPDASEAEKSYESQFVSHDRNFIDRHASTRAFWAMGVLSVEEDIQKLTLKS